VTAAGAVDVVRVGPEDWLRWRALRLEALADTPIGFGEWHADALVRPAAEWQARIRRPGLRLLAVGGGRPVAMAGGFLAGARPTVFAVYVTPAWRGRGVTDRLVAAVQEWAGPVGLRLEVHEDNAPATAAYLRLGFARTGGQRCYELDPARRLLEMERSAP